MIRRDSSWKLDERDKIWWASVRRIGFITVDESWKLKVKSWRLTKKTENIEESVIELKMNISTEFVGICSSWKLSPLFSTFCLDAKSWVPPKAAAKLKKSPPAAGRKASNFYGFGVIVLFPLLILSEPFSAPSEFLFLSVILRIPPKQRNSARLENLKIQCRCCSFVVWDSTGWEL